MKRAVSPKKQAPKRAAQSASARRVPLQARSKERVERILDAAEHEFAELGYESATTEAIAARAEASIGSLYQFFPNKRALFDALAERYLAGVEAFFGAMITEGVVHMSWADLIDHMFDAFWQFALQSKAFRAVWLTGHFSQELLHASDAINEAMEQRAEAALQVYAPQLSDEKRRAVAIMLIEMAGLVLFVAARKKEPLASAMVEEAKILMRAYVGQYAAPTPASSPSREKKPSPKKTAAKKKTRVKPSSH